MPERRSVVEILSQRLTAAQEAGLGRRRFLDVPTEMTVILYALQGVMTASEARKVLEEHADLPDWLMRQGQTELLALTQDTFNVLRQRRDSAGTGGIAFQ